MVYSSWSRVQIAPRSHRTVQARMQKFTRMIPLDVLGETQLQHVARADD